MSKRPSGSISCDAALPDSPVKRQELSSAERCAQSPNTDLLLDIAIRAVTYASRISVAVQSHMRRNQGFSLSIEKVDASPVTVADFAVQCLVTEYLSLSTGIGSALRLIAEEDACLLTNGRTAELAEVVRLLNEHFPFQELEAQGCGRGRQQFSTVEVLELLQRGNDVGGSHGSFWVLDPIDGTKGFVRDAQYAIGLGYVDRGVVALGAMACPNLPASGEDVQQRSDGTGFVFAGVRDWAGLLQLDVCYQRFSSCQLGLSWRDTFVNLRVAPPCPVESTRLCESFESKHRGKDEIRPKLLRLSAASVVRLDSMSKYGLVGRGDAHAYIRGGLFAQGCEKIWDHCAGVLIVVGAGGMVTDFRGHPLDFGCGRELSENHGILATNGALHAEIISEIARLRKEGAPDGELRSE